MHWLLDSSVASFIPSLYHPVLLSMPEEFGIAVDQWQLWGSSSLGQNETKQHPAPSRPERCQGQESTTGARQARICMHSDSSRHGLCDGELQQLQWFHCSLGSMWSLTLTFWDPSCPETPKCSPSHPPPPPTVSSLGATSPRWAVPVFRNINSGAHRWRCGIQSVSSPGRLRCWGRSIRYVMAAKELIIWFTVILAVLSSWVYNVTIEWKTFKLTAQLCCVWCFVDFIPRSWEIL